MSEGSGNVMLESCGLLGSIEQDSCTSASSDLLTILGTRWLRHRTSGGGEIKLLVGTRLLSCRICSWTVQLRRDP